MTEEEVSISKEKKICIVCKGSIAKLNYMCGECGAFYCLKCYEALTNLENSCWACDRILDESKPIKRSEFESEAIEPAIEHKKK